MEKCILKKPKKMKISEKKAKELLSRMAKAVGLKLVEWPRDAWCQNSWCFSNGKSRFTCNYFSLEEMLRAVLGLGEFSRCPGTWDAAPGEKTRYSNPFCGLSSEELELKLDLMCPKKPAEKREGGEEEW